MLEIVFGKSKNQTVINQLIEQLSTLDLNGTLYIGYPILASADDTVSVDALLISSEHGLLVFQIFMGETLPYDSASWDSVLDSQDQVYFAVKNSLSRHPDLRLRRELGVEIHPITLFPENLKPPEGFEQNIAGPDSLDAVISSFPPIQEKYLKHLNAALQRVTTIKPVKKRSSVSSDGSRGAVLKLIEKEIANLDQWQKRAAIESPEGPQRIRGLAGSGKTVVLALKAAYLHAQNPDWTIAVTFHTRSLYQQLTDLIRRFSFEHLGDEPDWDKIKIIHAWGGNWRPGLYTEIANHCGVNARDWVYGKSKYGMAKAFSGVCEELLSHVSQSDLEPLYDAVLIDEAQDLPGPFFRLVYKFTKAPKRIVWAYDELQNLSEAAVPSVADWFGVDANGEALVSLSNVEGQPRQDIILPVCYRNTPWALTLAHALGFGVYRDGGEKLVQHFDEPSQWTEIGYSVVEGSLELGQRVLLERSQSSYPSYFSALLTPEDAVVSQRFEGPAEQIEGLAERIKQNLTQDELEHDDILIILPEALTAKKKASKIMDALARRGIASHLSGVTSSQDEMFTSDSVAIANIFRAKGNEAPMVYILDCQYCVSGYELTKIRNILFTAITRSRAWVRLYGWGEEMDLLLSEVQAVVENRYRLNFTIPTEEQLKQLRMIHRDRTAMEKTKIKKYERGLADFLKALQRGEVTVENLPPSLRKQFEKLLLESGLDNEEF